ncbi:MAG: hypothetical protein JJU36_05780 [Phycisphaeraceae bacterium]|nr:hypothetical protein [Phycisphaeraceae bacterium]
MSNPRVDVEPTFVFQCYLTDESGDWECRYCPDDPEDTQITLSDGSQSGTFQMSVETARAVAHIILAAVDKYDCDKRFEELIARTKER